jgi:alpha-galactosidase
MDAGWYANGTWWETVGEWEPFEGRFPNGIKRVFDYVREKGMIPGIWLEIEVMGINCPLAKEWEDDCFFMRHGKRVIDHGRYQLDFRNPKVRAYATATVDRMVREYGVGYIKMDYNIDAGLGTELNADSFGDGLLKHNRAYLAWLDEILAKYPDLIWENCSSGGMRMEYAMLQRAHVQSVSDQSNYKKMAPIAAAAPTAVLPEQAAIWSYPRAEEDLTAVTFNMVSSMLQRIHLSGKVHQMSDEALEKMGEGVAVYKQLRGEIATALPFFPLGLPDDRSDWLCLGLKTEKRVLLAVWRTGAKADEVLIPVCGRAEVLYASACRVAAAEGGLRVTLPGAWSAALLSVEVE